MKNTARSEFSLADDASSFDDEGFDSIEDEDDGFVFGQKK